MDKRDLNEDLRICAEATVHVDNAVNFAYEWDGNEYRVYTQSGIEVAADISDEGYARFIAGARTGWPHAIERALTAEARLSAFQSSNVINFKRACTAEVEVARLRTLFRELMEHVSEPFLAYNDAEHAVKFYANHVRETVEYVHDTAKEALYDGRQP
jgi:hypothetical protein